MVRSFVLLKDPKSGRKVGGLLMAGEGSGKVTVTAAFCHPNDTFSHKMMFDKLNGRLKSIRGRTIIIGKGSRRRTVDVPDQKVVIDFNDLGQTVGLKEDFYKEVMNLLDPTEGLFHIPVSKYFFKHEGMSWCPNLKDRTDDLLVHYCVRANADEVKEEVAA